MRSGKKWFSCALGLIIFLLSLVWRQYQVSNNFKVEQAALQKRQQEILVNDFWQALKNTDKADELKILLENNLEKLPLETQSRAKAIIKLKIASAIFQEAEKELFGVIELVKATNLQEPHALTAPTMERIKNLYKEAKNEVDQLEDLPDDTEYNHCLNYLRGEIYYRIAQTSAGPEEINEVVRQIISSYKKALLVKSRDIDTEINVEILRKNMAKMTANSNLPSSQVIKQLSQQGVGSGSGRGKY